MASWPFFVSIFGRWGAGTLISPDAALTAAHICDNVASGMTVQVREKDAEVRSTHPHPTWDPLHPTHGIDIAVLRLAPRLTDTPHFEVHSRSDELGQQIVLLGRGEQGTGDLGATGHDGSLRLATNRITLASGNVLLFRQDRPPDTTALEGVSGMGDSGGPALISSDRTHGAGAVRA